MKKIINLSILLAVILTLTSCNAFKGWFGKSGPDILITAGTPYASACTVSDDYVIFRDLTMTTKGKDGYITGYTIGVQLSTDASFPKGSTVEAEVTDVAYPKEFISSSGTYRGSVKVEGLTKGTKYSYRTFAQYKGKTVYGSTHALTTYTNLATSVSVGRDRLGLRINQGEYVSVSVFPEDAQDRNDLVWESSDESVAVVRFGSITGVGVGSCTITVTSTKGHSASLRVDVRKVAATGLKLGADSITVAAGTLAKWVSELRGGAVSAMVMPDSASVREVTFYNHDPEIMELSPEGKITALQRGEARVTVTSVDDPSLSAEAHVFVAEVEPAGEFDPMVPVDLGLSVKWGHYTSGKPNPYGDGKVLGGYVWGNPRYYKYGDGPVVSEHPEEAPIFKRFMDDEHDMATANFGKPWRLPYYEEIEELEKNTRTIKVATDGLGFFGFTVYISKKSPSNAIVMSGFNPTGIWSRNDPNSEHGLYVKNIEEYLAAYAHIPGYKANVSPICCVFAEGDAWHQFEPEENY